MALYLILPMFQVLKHSSSGLQSLGFDSFSTATVTLKEILFLSFIGPRLFKVTLFLSANFIDHQIRYLEKPVTLHFDLELFIY